MIATAPTIKNEYSLIFEPITEAQRQGLESTSSNLLFVGQGGSGKTHLGAIKAIVIGLKYPNNRIFLIRKKKVDLRVTLWQKFIELLPEASIVQKDQNQMVVKCINGTEFWGFGLDSEKDVKKLASTECGMAVVEEAIEIPEKYYDEKIKRAVRLPRVPFHQTILLCNPGSPSHWIHKKWYEEKHPGYEMIFFKTLPPPFLPQTFYDWLKGLTGIWAQRYREGTWVALEGLVYPFDPKVNILHPGDPKYPRRPFSKNWRIWQGCDFGFDHAFVYLWWAQSPNDYWYCYRQIYMTQRTVRRHAQDILRLCEIDDIEPRAICDWDAEGMATLRECGIKTRRAFKDRLEGQQLVYELFPTDELPNRIFFLSDSLVETDVRRELSGMPIRTEQEFPTYIWANKAKEDMIKELDDGMDAMRYVIATVRRKAHKIKRSRSGKVIYEPSTVSREDFWQ